MEEEKKIVGIRFDKEVIKRIKLHCVENDMSVQQYIEGLVKKDLKIK